MRYLLFLSLTWLAGQCCSPELPDFDTQPLEPPLEASPIPEHIRIARQYIGVPEQDTIEMFLQSVELPYYNPWCSAFLSYVLDKSLVKMPTVRSGLARDFVYKTSETQRIRAGRVLAGVETVPKGSIVVYQRGNTIFGHNGIITQDWTGVEGVYISGNTSPPGGGSEASGGGVWEKPARINPNANLSITDFVFVEP